MKELTFVGPRLRSARMAKGLTLQQLSSRAEMSPSTLSRLESGKRQATLDLLLPLTKCLGLSLDDLVASETEDPRIRRDSVRRDGMVITPLASEASPTQTYRIRFAPEDTVPEPRIHDGYEWLYVLSGSLRLRLGQRDIVLTSGEAAEFDTRVPHSLSATAEGPVEVISIFSDSGVRTHADLSPID